MSAAISHLSLRALALAGLMMTGAAKPSPVEHAIASYEAAHPGVRHSGGEVTPPKLLVMENPRFPPEVLARRRTVAGIILLEAIVNERGVLEDPVFLRREQPDLQPYILKSLGKWRYQPARLKGKPVPVFLILTTNIHLQ